MKKKVKKEKQPQEEEMVNQETSQEIKNEQQIPEETQDELPESEEESQCDKLSKEVAEWQDKYARLSAEFDNFRKRTLKEKMDLIVGGSEKAVLALLPVVDDLERAVANTKDEGVTLILNKMMDALKSLSVVKIESQGQEFDVEVHNAIAKFPAADDEMKGKIIDVVKNGYRLGEKVIRHAEVVVGE